MLRNSFTLENNLKQLNFIKEIKCRGLQTTVVKNASKQGSASSLGRQSKVLNKLFGARLSGSKKRWFPSSNTKAGETVMFSASQFGKPSGSGSGKNTSRRSAVLNKLFMKNITDLLATGGASEKVLGRGMQVTRVKISPDFSYINVYWLANGDPINEGELEKILSSCAGYIRHELSQLCLMSQVPKIFFVRDKTNMNIDQVANVLKTIDFSSLESSENNEDETLSNETREGISYDSNWREKKQFFGQPLKTTPEDTTKDLANVSEFPAMRHDVLGLDHQDIMSRISMKMKKSKQAWEAHRQGDQFSSPEDSKTFTKPSLEEINEKISLADEKEAKFKEFLAKRFEKKNVPDRKKFRAADHILPGDIRRDVEDELALPKKLKQLYEMEDYVEEDDLEDKPR